MSTPFMSSMFMFNFVPVVIMVGFVVILAVILIRTAQGVAMWGKNNNSPLLTVPAYLVAKRTAINRQQTLNNVNRNLNDGNVNHFNNVTIYFATFQVQSGDRMEFRIPDQEYGLLAENDFGQLTFQGTRYKKFERNLQNENKWK